MSRYEGLSRDERVAIFTARFQSEAAKLARTMLKDAVAEGLLPPDFMPTTAPGGVALQEEARARVKLRGIEVRKACRDHTNEPCAHACPGRVQGQTLADMEPSAGTIALKAHDAPPGGLDELILLGALPGMWMDWTEREARRLNVLACYEREGRTPPAKLLVPVELPA